MDETSTASEGPSRTFAPLLHLSASRDVVPTTTLAVGPGPSREPDASPKTAPRLDAAPGGQAGAGRASVTQAPSSTPHALDAESAGVEITRLPWGYAVTITTRTP